MERFLHGSWARALRSRLLSHYDRRRRDLPWRGERNAYPIWVSEVMLQQTRVETAVPYYRKWMERFPTLEVLADADPDEVLGAWSGLGYYRRARDLHRAARIVRDQYGGRLPADPTLLRGLPGIGTYTAGAIASIAFGRREPAVDGNARRVLARLSDLERPSPAELRRLAGALVPADRPGDFNQALMELGATLCLARRPRCGHCPLRTLCLARRRGTIGSRPGARPTRTIPEDLVGTAVVVSGRGRILLARRPEPGLLAGMWEFPGAIADPGERPAAAARRAARGLLGPRALREDGIGRAFAVIRHAFSHRRHVYHAYRYTIRGEPPPRTPAEEGGDVGPRWTAAGWVRDATLGERPLPAAQRRIAAALLAADADLLGLPHASGSSIGPPAPCASRSR